MSPQRDGPFLRKLSLFAKLAADDRRAIEACTTKARRVLVSARDDLVREGETPTHIHLFLSGWACRYKQLEDGRRQILAFFLPGDICDLNIWLLQRMDHAIGAITSCSVARLTPDDLEQLTAGRPGISRALFTEMLSNAALHREWILNLGQRTATERIAHLLCESFLRMRAIGLNNGEACEFPLTQTDIADTTGLSVVHVNRTLQELRGAGAIMLKDRMLTIPNLPRLMSIACFDSNYLQFRDGTDGVEEMSGLAVHEKD